MSVMEIALQTMQGHLRAINGTLTAEDLYKNRDQFASSVQKELVRLVPRLKTESDR